jgi:hypothetical protein
MPLSKFETIHIYQGVICRALNYGTVTATGTAWREISRFEKGTLSKFRSRGTVGLHASNRED